jgi:UDP-glucose 4-epimerase
VSRDSVLLLGGTGFIGSALAKRLKQEKTSVHVLGRPDVERLEHVLPQCGTVVHLASATTPGSSASQPSLELSNLNLTLRVLERLKQQPDTHLIFFSSGGTIYGNAECLPITEDSPIAPLSNHGAGKASQEAFCQAARAQGHAITILRPSNAYGSGQGLRSGFGLVRTMLEHARAGTPLEIWGDGENVRDFIYIDDIVEACIRLIRRPQDSGTYNLGSGTGYSVNQARDIVEEVTGAELKVSRSPTRHIDVRSVVLDIGHIQRELDWTPKIVLDEGVRRTWRWLRREAP